jgi:hypothetical protein
VPRSIAYCKHVVISWKPAAAGRRWSSTSDLEFKLFWLETFVKVLFALLGLVLVVDKGLFESFGTLPDLNFAACFDGQDVWMLVMMVKLEVWFFGSIRPLTNTEVSATCLRILFIFRELRNVPDPDASIVTGSVNQS